MKKLLTSLTALMLVLSVCLLPAAAFTPVERELPLVYDEEVYVLSDAEYESLNAKAEQISADYECEVAVVFVDNVGSSSATDYADDFYDYNGYGYGSEDDGVLLLVAVGSRDYAITTHGFGIYAFTDYGLDLLENRVVDHLGDNDWAGAADTFLSQCEHYLDLARQGTPIDVPPKEPANAVDFLIRAVLALACGFLLSGIPMGAMVRQMKSVARRTGAGEYVTDVTLSVQEDRFRNMLVERTRIEHRESSGGGSSTHTSSSGRTHGGSSGKF